MTTNVDHVVAGAKDAGANVGNGSVVVARYGDGAPDELTRIDEELGTRAMRDEYRLVTLRESLAKC
ncbi:MAG: hypothetical protein ACK5ZG_13835 [Phycisphaerae bacterium]|jgi:hypothetical protein